MNTYSIMYDECSWVIQSNVHTITIVVVCLFVTQMLIEQFQTKGCAYKNVARLYVDKMYES